MPWFFLFVLFVFVRFFFTPRTYIPMATPLTISFADAKEEVLALGFLCSASKEWCSTRNRVVLQSRWKSVHFFFCVQKEKQRFLNIRGFDAVALAVLCVCVRSLHIWWHITAVWPLITYVIVQEFDTLIYIYMFAVWRLPVTHASFSYLIADSVSRITLLLYSALYLRLSVFTFHFDSELHSVR